MQVLVIIEDSDGMVIFVGPYIGRTLDEAAEHGNYLVDLMSRPDEQSGDGAWLTGPLSNYTVTCRECDPDCIWGNHLPRRLLT